jgi:cytochrome P450
MRRSTFFALGAAAVVGAYTYLRQRATPRHYFRSRSAANTAAPLHIPGPAPVLQGRGNILKFLLDPINHAGMLFREYGPVVALAAGTRTNILSIHPYCPGTVFITGAEQMRAVAAHHDTFHRYSVAGTFYPIADPPARLQPLREWGSGLFNVNGETHRGQRRLMLPAFHRKRVEGYRDLMVEATNTMLDSWQPGEVRDMHHAMMTLTMRIATGALFGAALAEDGERISENIAESLQLFFHPLTGMLRYDIPGFPYHRFLNLAGEVSAGMRELTARKRALGADQGDVLAMLLAATDEHGQPLTETELAGHTALLFAAGHETSSNALTWTLLLLAQHPNIAAALHDELDGELHGEAPTIEQLGRLPLLERIIKESMRIFPPVPLNTRVAHADSEVGGYAIPAGAEMLMSIYHIHHDAALYPEPERFDPMRWESIDPSTFEYTPFSGGPRMCIGAAFAMLEMKIALAMILQRYRFSMLPHARVDRAVAITMGPRQGLPMLVQRQDRNFTPAAPIDGNIHEMVRFLPPR